MTAFLLDANHLSPLVTVGHSLRTKLHTSVIAGNTFSIAASVLSEFLFGIGGLPRAEQNRREWQLLKDDFTIYSIDEGIASEAAELRLKMRKVGRQIALIDAFTAVIALRQNLVLLTTDKDFQVIPGLEQENWLLSV